MLLQLEIGRKRFPKLRLIEDFTPYELEQFLSNRGRAWLHRQVDTLDRHLFSRHRAFRLSLDPTTRTYVETAYPASNTRLAQLIGKDLRRYGYV